MRSRLLLAAVTVLAIAYAGCGAPARLSSVRPTDPATNGDVTFWLTEVVREDGQLESMVTMCRAGSAPPCIRSRARDLGEREAAAWLDATRGAE